MDPKRALSAFKDENLNPCLEEGQLTTKCLKENFYDSDKCAYYFENYRNCLKFWNTVKGLRMRHGTRPFLPDKEEREKILKEREKGNRVYMVR